MPALWQVSGREKRQDIGGVFSMTDKIPELTLEHLGVPTLEGNRKLILRLSEEIEVNRQHMKRLYEIVNRIIEDIAIMKHGEEEEPDPAELGQQRAEEREGYDDR
jgi:hypothetical protein